MKSTMINRRKLATDGNDGFVTDRDDKGNPKAPEQVEVPRVAAKKDEVEPLPEALPVPAAVPAPSGTSDPATLLSAIPTDMILKIVGELPKDEDFASNQEKQQALIGFTELLRTRPVEPAPVEERSAEDANP